MLVPVCCETGDWMRRWTKSRIETFTMSGYGITCGFKFS